MALQIENPRFFIRLKTRVLRYLFQEVQTQTTEAYCRVLPTLDPHVVQTQTNTDRTNTKLITIQLIAILTSLKQDQSATYTQTTANDVPERNLHFLDELKRKTTH